jgi:transcriptional regulator with XRE-family HTH domain
MDDERDPALKASEIGRRVTRYRERLGFRQAELAKRAGRSEAYVNRLENGLVRSPKIGDLSAIARALSVSLDALIYGESPRTDQDILAALARQPRFAVAMASLVKGLQMADAEDRDFVIGHLESLARRFGDRAIGRQQPASLEPLARPEGGDVASGT